MLHPNAISYEVCELHAARNRLLNIHQNGYLQI